MPLARIGSALLLAASGALASACQCCKRYFCNPIRINACGDPVYECVPTTPDTPPGSTLYATPDCNYVCEMTQLCCLEDPCPELQCLLCVDGRCVPCPAGYTCINGECVPDGPPVAWYCCFDSIPDSSSEWPDTHCQQGPCLEGHYASGPHANDEECAAACQPHHCDQDVCGGADCVPSSSGEHPTLAHCLASCEGIPEDDSATCVASEKEVEGECPCTFTGGQGTFNYFFNISPASRRTAANTLCVAYVSRGGHPINVSLWAPKLGPNCEVELERTSQGVSGWRGCEAVDCPDDRPPGSIEGGPHGRILWLNKQRGVTEFEVQIIAPCPDTQWEVVVSCGECHEFPDLQECRACVPYNAGPEYQNMPFGIVPASIQTITVPAFLTLPVTVTYSNGCDDGLVINGQRISTFSQVPPPFTITERTFEAAVWNDGGPWACGGEFCFVEANPLP